ncbi:MAG: hypothetical protein HY231_13240 [Acidobacteria bacterium]|nr:hypothetical protein [Acidobacteriota bacterium]
MHRHRAIPSSRANRSAWGLPLTRSFRVPFTGALRLILLLAAANLMTMATLAQTQESNQQTPPPPAAVERADDLKSKVTVATYLTSNDRNYDINLRHQFGHLVAWVGGFYDPHGDSSARIGAEYDFQHKWLLLVPTIQIGSTGALGASLYAEIGNQNYAIAGYSQTNQKPFNDLFFDPSESVQLGLGRKINHYDRLYGYTIFDVRLHTHQQDTHILWRHRLNQKNGITFDGLYKSGDTDDGKRIHAVGIGVYYDRPKWFWKAYYDPYVNFSNQTMVRVGAGLKF